MAILAKVGEFSLDPSWAVSSKPVVDCVGFPPKFAIFFYTRTPTSGNVLSNGANDTYNFGVGVASTRTIGRFAVESAGWNGSPDQYGIWKGSFNTRVIYITSSGENWIGSADGYVDFQTFTGSGFQFIVSDAVTQPWKVNYLAIGGSDITDVYSQTKRRPRHNISSGIADPGFKPDALFMLSADYGYNSSSSSVHDFSVGFADKNLNQGQVYHGYADFGEPAPYVSFGHAGSGEISAAVWADNYEPIGVYPRYFVDNIESFNTNGFTLHHYPIPSGEGLTASNSYFHYLVIKGALWKVGSFTTRADDGDIEVELGFKPAAIIFISSTKEQDSLYNFSQEGVTSFGIATSPTERRCITVWNDYVATESGFPLNIASAKYTDVVYANIVGGTLISSMDLKSITNTGFVCKMGSYVEPEDRLIMYMAVGAEIPTYPTTTGNDEPRVFMI